jgi:hypothetical protein
MRQRLPICRARLRANDAQPFHRADSHRQASVCRACQTLGIMVTQRRLKQTQEREYFAHHMLLQVATLELEAARASEHGRFNHCLVALTLSALAIEALANAVGSRAVDDWADFESASPYAKLRLLAERLGVAYHSAKEPWTTLRYLTRFRNAIAHAKPERILEEKVMHEAEYNAQLFRTPPSKVEREVTLGNASRCLNAVQSLKGLLTDAVPVERRFGLYGDMWSGSTELDRT